ncbi:hypothetical protein BC830DRAFT_1130804 [Chytriomyces sp. MP71]|nr:hypothetical protein BC830DRAFT_1130804 [Chytriomyces sp. MP71]
MLSHRRRSLSSVLSTPLGPKPKPPSSKSSSATKANKTPASKPRREFDTFVSDLSALRLTPAETRRRKKVRQECTLSHRAALARTTSATRVAGVDGVAAAVGDAAQDEGDEDSDSARIVSPALALERRLVDLDAELRNLDPPSSSRVRKPNHLTTPSVKLKLKLKPVSNTRQPPRGTVDPFDVPETVPHAIQSRLISLRESLETLSQSMGHSFLSEPEQLGPHNELPPTSDLHILAKTLDSAEVTVTTASRFISSHLLRMDSLASSLASVARAVQGLDARLKSVEEAVTRSASRTNTMETRVAGVEEVVQDSVHVLMGEVDGVKLELQAMALGKDVRTIFD